MRLVPAAGQGAGLHRPGADLLDVFEDVREEIASRGQELCLLIEDLVLLHGIDRQLAQALTIPASARLCRLRAAIAVTSGYLNLLRRHSLTVACGSPWT